MLKKIKDNLELICIVVIICIVFLLGKSCGNKVIKTLDPEIITITNYKDTIFPKDTVYEDKWHPSKPKHDTVWIPFDSVDVNKILVYNDTIKKPEYEAYTETTVQGILRDMKLGIKLKVPLIIKDCTLVKKDSLIYRPYKYEIHGGLVVGLTMLVPTIDLSIDRCTYSIGYNPFNRQPIIGFKYRLLGWTPKKRKK
jgi:hypothetical protein